MRRVAAGTVVLLAGLVLPAAAQATFHLEMVNEVMLASAGGDASVQFVELLDKGGSEEQFTPVFAPYKLVVYDGAGKQLGAQTLNPTGLRGAAASGAEYLISTAAADSAFGVTGDERLTVSLPRDVAQVCFQGNPGNVSCMTYGTITMPVAMNSMGTGAGHGPVPPDGESDQRQADGSVQAAAPTPKAPNRPGSGTVPGGGPNPAPGPASPPGSMSPAFTGVTFNGRVARVDRRGRALLALRCPAAASGKCTGQVTLTLGSRHARVGRASFALSPGAGGAIRLRLSAAARRMLARRSRLTVRASASAADSTGHLATSTATLTLKR
jgi:hypothetical protein